MLQPLSEGIHKSGKTVGNRYRLVELLGRGGTGEVWRAQPLDGGPEVAIKLLHELDEPVRRRFVHEARAAASLESPHVVHIREAGEDDGLPFMVMELLAGESLEARLARGPLAREEAARVLPDVGRAIALAHGRGIVHRDIKPANVFITPTGTSKVLDFGIAKLSADLLAGTTPTTQTGDQLGTPSYMSPEQLRSSKSVDHRADLWALGVLSYHCLVGEPPFRARKFGELVLAICLHPIPVPSTKGAVPAGFDAWFARATERAPDDRFQTVDEMMAALLPLLG